MRSIAPGGARRVEQLLDELARCAGAATSTARGVNALCTSRRSRVWSGGSIPIIESVESNSAASAPIAAMRGPLHVGDAHVVAEAGVAENHGDVVVGA